jgi:hypothetical protein
LASSHVPCPLSSTWLMPAILAKFVKWIYLENILSHTFFEFRNISCSSVTPEPNFVEVFSITDTHTHTHTYTHTPVSTPLNGWSPRRRDRYLHNTQQNQQTNNHSLGAILTRDPSHQAAAYLCFTPGSALHCLESELDFYTQLEWQFRHEIFNSLLTVSIVSSSKRSINQNLNDFLSVKT